MRKYKIFVRYYLSLSFLLMVFFYLMTNYGFNEDLLWVKEVKSKKDSYVNAEKNNKIVINSGSNALFGIRSKEITEQLGVPAYNMSMHAGLGLDFILEESKGFLKSGDTIILPLEHELLMNDFFGNTTKLAFDYYRLYEPEKVGRIIPIDRWRYTFQNNPMESIINAATSLLKKSSEIGYKSSNLNDHGDQINNIEYKETLIKHRQPITIPAQLKETIGLKKLDDFNKWCEANGIALYYTYPNMIFFEEYLNQNYQNYFLFLDQYFAEHHIKVLMKQKDSLYNKELFYDTDYHMNEKGVSLRTADIIKELRKVFVNK
ncbi:hypothetical protein [Paenibacillus periandrae]|uniref:hypothetical protein n=1 Tax=Paenibacillus periandrae TaxID=1761741 RepID=UPI001F08D014|nr:hypothetical protein [Paenibacillus periandrae]